LHLQGSLRNSHRSSPLSRRLASSPAVFWLSPHHLTPILKIHVLEASPVGTPSTSGIEARLRGNEMAAEHTFLMHSVRTKRRNPGSSERQSMVQARPAAAGLLGPA